MTDEFLFELIEAMKKGVNKYGKAEMRRLVEKICYQPKSLPNRRHTSLEHLRGIHN